MSRGRTPVALTLALALLAAATSAKAQQAGSPRIGWLGLPAQAANADLIAGFREGLRELGYTEGKNLIIDYRFAEGQSERLGHLAVELVGLPVNAIVVTSAPAAIAAKRATATIPIVMVTVGDPVGVGLIASLAKPGGNVTGSRPLIKTSRQNCWDCYGRSYPEPLGSVTSMISIVLPRGSSGGTSRLQGGRSACRCRSFPLLSPMLSSPN